MTGRRDFINLPQAEYVEGAGTMSDTIWCNIDDPATNTYPGGAIPGHPFPATDQERQHFAQTRQVSVQTGNSYGTPTFQEHQQVTVEMDICGYHWSRQNPFQQTPQKVQALKAAEEYNEGWEDARKHYEGIGNTAAALHDAGGESGNAATQPGTANPNSRQ